MVSGGDRQSALADFSLAMISEDIAPRMYQLVSALHHDAGGTINQEDVTHFTQLPGSHLVLSDPALEFSKSVCHVSLAPPDAS